MQLAHLERVRLGCEQRVEPADGMALPLQSIDGELRGRRECRQHSCPECGVAGLRQVEPGELHQRRMRTAHRRRPAHRAGEVRGLQLQLSARAAGLRREAHLRVAALADDELGGRQPRAQRRQRRIPADLPPQSQIRRQVEAADATFQQQPRLRGRRRGRGRQTYRAALDAPQLTAAAERRPGVQPIAEAQAQLPGVGTGLYLDVQRQQRARGLAKGLGQAARDADQVRIGAYSPARTTGIRRRQEREQRAPFGIARELGIVARSGRQHRLPHVHQTAPVNRQCGDVGLAPLRDAEADRAAQPLPGQGRGLQVAGRKGERAAQRIDRRQTRHCTQLRAIEHRRDARTFARLAHQHVDIEQRVTAQIDILQPGGVGAELRVLTQPGQRLLRAAGDAPGEMHGATARVPLGTRRDQLERPDLPAVDRRMHARAVPLDARIEMLRIGPGI